MKCELMHLPARRAGPKPGKQTHLVPRTQRCRKACLGFRHHFVGRDPCHVFKGFEGKGEESLNTGGVRARIMLNYNIKPAN